MDYLETLKLLKKAKRYETLGTWFSEASVLVAVFNLIDHGFSVLKLIFTLTVAALLFIMGQEFHSRSVEILEKEKFLNE